MEEALLLLVKVKVVCRKNDLDTTRIQEAIDYLVRVIESKKTIHTLTRNVVADVTLYDRLNNSEDLPQ